MVLFASIAVYTTKNGRIWRCIFSVSDGVCVGLCPIDDDSALGDECGDRSDYGENRGHDEADDTSGEGHIEEDFA